MEYSEEYLKKAHKSSFGNKADVMASEFCGCFYCKETYSATEVDEWNEENPPADETAFCPRCGMDSVIGSNSRYPVTEIDFLKAMNKFFF